MPTVSSRGTGLASSTDGRRLAWSEPGRLVLLDLVERTQLGELEVELEPPVELAIAGAANQERLLALQSKGGGTLMRVFALPDLRPLVNVRLRGESKVAALCGTSAVLVASEIVTIVDLAELRTATLPVRGPIQVIAAVSDDQLLVGTRGKLEAWNLDERRPTHKVGLPLPIDAAFAGTASAGRLFWFASASAPGMITVNRLSDGKLLHEFAAGGSIKAITADAASAIAVALVETDAGKPPRLVVLDLQAQSRRVLPFDGHITAFCLTGAPADGVAVRGEQGDPVVLPLAPNAVAQPLTDFAKVPAEESAAPQAAAAETSTKPNTSRIPVAVGATPSASTRSNGAKTPQVGDSGLGDKLSQWRAQLHEAMHSAPVRAKVAGRSASDEPRSRSRAELYAWGQAARNRSTTTPPPPPQGWRLDDLVTRFKLDVQSKTVLALLYSSWLDGEGKTGLPVAVIARALGNDEDAWVEALAQGRLGHMGWIRTSFGRTRIRPVVGRYLDDAPPRIAVVTPAEENPSPVAPPTGPAVLQLADGVGVDEHARELALWLGGPVATIDLAALPSSKLERVLAERVLETRLHGALPIVLPGEGAVFDLTVLDGPALIAIRGTVPAQWRALPVWPPVADAPAPDDTELPPRGDPAVTADRS